MKIVALVAVLFSTLAFSFQRPTTRCVTAASGASAIPNERYVRIASVPAGSLHWMITFAGTSDIDFAFARTCDTCTPSSTTINKVAWPGTTPGTLGAADEQYLENGLYWKSRTGANIVSGTWCWVFW